MVRFRVFKSRAHDSTPHFVGPSVGRSHFTFWAAAPKGTKSCRTQEDFRSTCLKKWMRCYRGLIKGLQEPKLRSEKADVRPENANWKLERADLGLERAGLRLERSED